MLTGRDTKVPSSLTGDTSNSCARPAVKQSRFLIWQDYGRVTRQSLEFPFPFSFPFALASKSLVNALPEFLSRFEMGYMFGRQSNRITGLRISANARRTIMQGKTSKPPDLDPLPGRKCPAHLFKQTFDRQLDILVIQMSVFSREYLDQFRLCHFIHQPG